MNKYQKWTVIFCLCFSASVIFGQVAKSWFAYATLTGWFWVDPSVPFSGGHAGEDSN